MTSGVSRLPPAMTMTSGVSSLPPATTMTSGVSSLPPATSVQPELPPAVLNLHNNCDESEQESRVESADVSTCPYRMDHIKSLLRPMTCYKITQASFLSPS